MDEKSVSNFFKKAIKIYTLVFLILCIIAFIYLIITDQFNVFDYKTNIKNIVIYYINMGIFIFVPYILMCIKRVIDYIKRKINCPKNNQYFRDITIKYSPAIISLLLDLQMTTFKDYTAMILYLHWRKFIEIQFENDEPKFIILKENIEELNPHEQYIFRCIQGSAFHSSKFKDLVIEDARHMNLIICNNGIMKRTNKGKKEAVLWKGFKNYIHDYTLISEKNIEHVKVLEEYIPYAIALDEAKSIEKFIKEDEKYRKLIY